MNFKVVVDPSIKDPIIILDEPSLEPAQKQRRHLL